MEILSLIKVFFWVEHLLNDSHHALMEVLFQLPCEIDNRFFPPIIIVSYDALVFLILFAVG